MTNPNLETATATVLPPGIDLSAFDPIPDQGIRRAVQQLREGALYRYCGEGPKDSEVALLEREWAQYVGSRYAVAINSCGSGLYISLLALGVRPGDKVLMSAFTYTAVPSAIVNAGAIPVLIECDEDYCIDLHDLRRKITRDSRVLLVSHMRGHIANMEAVVAISDEFGLDLIEDCAHSLGGRYNGIHTGRFGKAGSFSTQSHKMVNSGEGGVLITDDEDLYVKAVLYAGSQEQFWKKHFFESAHFAKYQESIPNLSTRMSNLTAAVLRPQLALVDEWMNSYERNYATLADMLCGSEHVYIPVRNSAVRRGPDTLQFTLPHFDEDRIALLTRGLNSRGLPIKLFGRPGSPRFFRSWGYIEGIEAVHLPQTEAILKHTYDIRLPRELTLDDVRAIGMVILNAVNEVA